MIYHGAVVTISAACATTCHEGYLYRRKPEIAALPCVHSDGRLGVLNLYREFNVADEPIHKRAWTLQEHVQSCCILEFGTQQLRRICRGDPDNAEVLQHYDPAKDDKAVWTFAMTPEKILKDYWRRLIRDFTSRQIKYTADRPLAIQAIANEYTKVLKKTYLAGLWGEDFLPRELLWRRDELNTPAPRPDSQTAPSWSWFAVEKTVITWEDWPGDYKDDTIEILGHNVHPHLGYRTLSHNTSLLKVKGYLRKATWNSGGSFLVSKDGEKPWIVAKAVADAVEAQVDLNQDVLVETLEVLRTP